MKLENNELSLVILGMEALMEQLNDDYQDNRDLEVRKRYYDCWDIANKARVLLSQK